jgi:hypothetical protein
MVSSTAVGNLNNQPPLDMHVYFWMTYVSVSTNVVVAVSGPKITPICVVTDSVVVVTNICRQGVMCEVRATPAGLHRLL